MPRQLLDPISRCHKCSNLSCGQTSISFGTWDVAISAAGKRWVYIDQVYCLVLEVPPEYAQIVGIVEEIVWYTRVLLHDASWADWLVPKLILWETTDAE